MSRFKYTLTIVVPTKDRPNELRRMLESLAAQSHLPDEVIVAGEGEGVGDVTGEFLQLNAKFLNVPGLSICEARNAGARVARPDVTLIGFMDDDIVLEPGALEAMLAFWETAPAEVGGAGFNFRNVLAPETERKWKLRPTTWMYDLFMLRNQPKGVVLRSGFPTPLYPVTENLYVDWLETIGLVLRREVVERFQFDDFFTGYTYMDHLDYTYGVSRRYKLCVVSNAWLTHYSSPIRNSYLLGKKQVINRVHFVRKHPELSVLRCCFILGLHVVFNLVVGCLLWDGGYLRRAWGNCAGFAQMASGRMRPVPGGIK